MGRSAAWNEVIGYLGPGWLWRIRNIAVSLKMRWIMKYRVVLIKSVFPASRDMVWEKLQ